MPKKQVLPPCPLAKSKKAGYAKKTAVSVPILKQRRYPLYDLETELGLCLIHFRKDEFVQDLYHLLTGRCRPVFYEFSY